jgi:hypothetical protein
MSVAPFARRVAQAEIRSPLSARVLLGTAAVAAEHRAYAPDVEGAPARLPRATDLCVHDVEPVD